MALIFFSARYSSILKTSLFCSMTATPLWIIFRFTNGNHGFMMVHMLDTGFRDSHSSSDCVISDCVIYFKFCHLGVEMETRKLSGKLKNFYMGCMWWSNTLSSFCNRNKDTILLASETKLSSWSAVMQA